MDYPKNKQHTKTSIYIKKPAESFKKSCRFNIKGN